MTSQAIPAGATGNAAPYPSPGTAWYMVGVLTLMYVFSFIDRQILGLLVDPIKAEFGVSDTQVGLLQGLTFALFYCTLGLPMGWLVDRISRRWLAAAGVFFWSLAATACGMAQTFTQLLLARIGVGVGESTLSPAAYSMISDAFPKEKLGRALGAYNVGIGLGSGLALIMGGLVVSLVASTDAMINIPLLGEIRPWQVVFIVTGAPGILLCLLFFTVPEPARRGLMRDDSAGGSGAVKKLGLIDTAKFLMKRADLYIVLFCSYGMLSIIGYGYLGWLPVALNRKYGVDIGDIAMINGFITLFFNTAGLFFIGRVHDALSGRRKDAAVFICVFLAMATGTLGAIGPLMPNLWATFAVLIPFSFVVSAYATLAPISVALTVPNQMRGQAAALYLLINNIIGLGVGPALMPFVSDFVIGDPNMVYLSIAVVTGSCGVLAICGFLFTRPRYQRAVEESEAWAG